MFKPLTRIQESFSAKITVLVACSVIITSFVVGLATTHSTGEFLTDRMTDRFPSTLTTTITRVRLWHGRQLGELDRLGRSESLRSDLARVANDGSERRDKARSQAAVFLRLVKPSYSVYRELIVLGANGQLIASTIDVPADAARRAEEAWIEIGEKGFEAGASRPIFGQGEVRQWVFVLLGDSTAAPAKRSWLIALVDLGDVTHALGEVKLGNGGDVFLLDERGRFITQPRSAQSAVLGKVAMQVPTRQEGPVLVERRSNYEGRRVFQSKVHIDELGWWLVYEEDYRVAMTPVLEAQKRIWVAVLVVGAIAILSALRIAQSILKPIHALALGRDGSTRDSWA